MDGNEDEGRGHDEAKSSDEAQKEPALPGAADSNAKVDAPKQNHSDLSRRGAQKHPISSLFVDGDGEQGLWLDGQNSYDPDGDHITYSWQENGVHIYHNALTFTSLTVGTHTITLTVTDNKTASHTDTVIVTVLPQP